MNADEVLSTLGSWGRYQLGVFASLCFVYMRGTWPVLAVIFMGADPGHECSISVTPNTSQTQYPDGQCNVIVQQNGANVTEACSHGYSYGPLFESTILTEFDLVCEQDYLVDLSTTIYMVGNSLGAIFITPLSDRLGRKWTLLVCLWIQGLIGVGVAFANSYILFTILRFFVGFLNMAIALITYVMVTEVFPAKSRTRPSVGVNLCWSIGILVLSLFGYFFRDWRHLELLISIPNFITFFYIWSLPESIPWLMSRHKHKQLEKVVRHAARVNNVTLPSGMFHEFVENCEEDISTNFGQKADTVVNTSVTGHSDVSLTTTANDRINNKQYTILDLFKTPKIRRYTFIMLYLWFVNSLGYFGILLSTPSLHGNIFVNLAISGAVEIPACILCIFVLEKTGRKRPLVFFMLLCGVMNIAAVFIPATTESGTDLGSLIIALAMIGKFGITGAYSTVYLMSAEIFPTPVRNQAVGLSSFFENAGGIAAPFIVYGAKNLAQMPLVLFGVLTVIGGILAFFLPETHNKALPDTIDMAENINKLEQDHDTQSHITRL